MSTQLTLSDDQLDRVFHALADRTRRALLSRMAKGPCTIGLLATPFKMSLPAVSKHIRVLENAGLVERAVDGRLHHCHLSTQTMQSADAWLSQQRAFWEESLDALADYVEEKKPKPTRRK